jgi:hypothetical protein
LKDRFEEVIKTSFANLKTFNFMEAPQELTKEEIVAITKAYAERMSRAASGDETIDLATERIGLILERRELFQFFSRKDLCDKVFLLFGIDTDKNGKPKQTVILMGLNAEGRIMMDDSKYDPLAYERWRNTIDRNLSLAAIMENPEARLSEGVLQ